MTRKSQHIKSVDQMEQRKTRSVRDRNQIQYYWGKVENWKKQERNTAVHTA